MLETGLETLGMCPECQSTVLNEIGGSIICADCGYKETHQFYAVPEMLADFEILNKT